MAYLTLISVQYILYKMYVRYFVAMEDKVMGIGELRANLGSRVEAAFHHGEPTIVEHGKRGERRAALIPYAWLEELYRHRGAPVPDVEPTPNAPRE